MRKAAMIVGDFLKKNIVFCIAVTAAIVTMFFVPIDSQYIQYFDFKILACIFCVLAVVNGLHHIHFFEIISKAFSYGKNGCFGINLFNFCGIYDYCK